jgi:hypothetical protein
VSKGACLTCGHDFSYHTHLHRRTYCAFCDCKAFMQKGRLEQWIDWIYSLRRCPDGKRHKWIEVYGVSAPQCERCGARFE